MKTLLLYTSHRQVEELEIARFFYNRDPFLKTLDVRLHCNNPKINQKLVSEIVNGFEAPNVKIDFTSNNSGHHSGVAEAINSLYEELSDYDFVIHTHPDIFILHADKIKKTIEENYNKDVDYIAWQIHRTHGLAPGKRRDLEYASDFFIFKPKSKNNVFKHYKEYWEKYPKSGCERFLGYQIEKSNLTVADLDRGELGGMEGGLESLGIWHCHNLSLIKTFIKNNYK